MIHVHGHEIRILDYYRQYQLELPFFGFLNKKRAEFIYSGVYNVGVVNDFVRLNSAFASGKY